MNHIPADNLWALALDAAALTEGHRAHLAICETCQKELNSMRSLAAELNVLKLSAPSPLAQARYRAHFALVHQPEQTSPMQRLRQLVAELVVDSRLRPAVAGLRSAGATDYRLLYSASTADIELLVRETGPHRDIRGEILFAGSPEPRAGTLLQLVDGSGRLASETLADADGSFRLREVPPGGYSLLIMPADGPELWVQALELS